LRQKPKNLKRFGEEDQQISKKGDVVEINWPEDQGRIIPTLVKKLKGEVRT